MSAPRGMPTRSNSAGDSRSEGASAVPSDASPRSRVAPAKPALEPVEIALCRSVLWEALALGFRAPTAETVERLAAAEGAGALAAAAAALGGDDGDDLAACARALGSEPPAALVDLQVAYDRLFGHTARGLVPPYETEYGEDSPFQPQREMSDLGAFFRAVGLVLRPGAHERADHLACECELMLVLTRKEAHAREIEDAPMVEETGRAARLFLRDHLGRWAPAFGRKLAREDPGRFYGALGGLCTRFVTAECRRAAVAAGPELLRLRSTDAADAPMACGRSPDACGT